MAPNWFALYDYGFSVFPIPYGFKGARSGWEPYQTERASLSDIIRWSKSNSNVAVATGAVSGVFVFDVDSDECQKRVDALGIPKTPCVATSKGRHYYFKWPGFNVRNQVNRSEGYDIRGDGGYVVGPGSVHPSGTVYDWLVSPLDAVFADAPEWLVDIVTKTNQPVPRQQIIQAENVQIDAYSGYASAALDAEICLLRAQTEGSRNDQLNKSAFALGQLVGAGVLQYDQVYDQLYTAALDIGLLERETQASLNSGLTAGIKEPRQLPQRELATSVLKVPTERTSEPVQRDLGPVPTTGLTGVLGELVDHLDLTAAKPQRALALGASLSVLGALMGRKYVTRFASNLYVVGVAKSGAGKNHAMAEIIRLFSMAGLSAYVGPKSVASAAGLLDVLRAQPSIWLPLDEFGHTLARMTAERASEHAQAITHTLTELYTTSKSEHTGTAYSKRGGTAQDHTALKINKPCLCLYGMTTPDQFWGALKRADIIDGTLARMLIVHAENDNPPFNWSAPENFNNEPLQQRLKVIADGGGIKLKGNLNGAGSSTQIACEPYRVKETPGAEARFRDYADAIVAECDEHQYAPILHRRGEQVAKVALILAVSDCASEPVVNVQHVDWAIRFVTHCSESLIQNIERHVADNQIEQNHKRALTLIRESGSAGISRQEFCRRTQYLSKRERSDILASLEDSGQVVSVAGPKPARGPSSTVLVAS